jgi:hypothetical protein
MSKFRSLLSAGANTFKRHYARSLTSVLFCSRKQLEIRDLDNSLMAVVSGTLPDSIRQSLCRDLMLCFEDEGKELLHLTDTKKDGDPFFQTVHFSWYNRYATKVRTLLYPDASQG